MTLVGRAEVDGIGAQLALTLAPYAITAAHQFAAKGATIMAGTSIVAARERYARARLRVAHEVQRRKHTMTAVAISGALGMAEAKGKRLPELMGMDGTVWGGVAALIAGEYLGGDTGKIMQSVADGLLSVGAWKLGRAAGGSAVKGAEEDAKAFDALLAAS
jgi:hypothetical protein